eukprot:1785267-Ditylum_brightwellii.AAC.1
MHIYFNNINGISSDEEAQGNMEFMREIDADLWGWVETNRTWTEDQNTEQEAMEDKSLTNLKWRQ